MKEIKILNKVICKALDNGWLKGRKELIDFSLADSDTYYWFFWKDNTYDVFDSIYSIIFNHEFAKAFFGEGKRMKGKWVACFNWQYHLQQMVLEEDPIKYLEQSL